MIEKIEEQIIIRQLLRKKKFRKSYLPKLIFDEWISTPLFNNFYKPYLLKMLSERGYMELAESITKSNIADVLDFELMIYNFPILSHNVHISSDLVFNPFESQIYKTREIRCSYAKIEAPNLRFPIKYKLISSIDGYDIFEKILQNWETYFIEYVCNKYFEPIKEKSTPNTIKKRKREL